MNSIYNIVYEELAQAKEIYDSELYEINYTI